jgi:hypothetical protein
MAEGRRSWQTSRRPGLTGSGRQRPSAVVDQLRGQDERVRAFEIKNRVADQAVNLDEGTGALYLDKPQEIQAYEPVWANIDATSLNEAQSKKLIQAVAKEYAS